MVSSYSKSVFRTIKSQIGQFLAMTAIIILGVGFVTGIGASAPNFRDTVSKYYNQAQIADIIIKTPAGISGEQKNALDGKADIFRYEEIFCYDTEVNGLCARIYHMPLSGMGFNTLQLLDGKMPAGADEVLAERSGKSITELNVGDQIEYNGIMLTVSGIVSNPLYLSKEPEQDMTGDKRLQSILYFDSAFAGIPAVTDVYIKLAATDGLNHFSKKYKDAVNAEAAKLEALQTGSNPLIALTLEQNASAALLAANADRLDSISYVFPVFFILIASLVVLSIMTRMVEKERTVIGCYKTLGFSNRKIIFKYVLFALICCIAGSVAGLLAGFRILPLIIYDVYSSMFHFPPLSQGFYYTFGIIASLIMTAAVLGVTLYVAGKSLKEKPADLLRQKAPGIGRKFFLERIPLIWNKIKFKYKSTLRNVFRYAKHLVMTIVSIAGCFGLVFAGFGIYDSINNAYENSLNGLATASVLESMIFVVIILIVSAGTLSVIVVYSLTNINIEERKREIATLKVLGYKNTEVAGYIYREVFILTFLGILAGLPLGYGLVHFVLTFMDSGLKVVVYWYSWFISIFVIALFTVVTALLLYRKINRIDMNASLKSNE